MSELACLPSFLGSKLKKDVMAVWKWQLYQLPPPGYTPLPMVTQQVMGRWWKNVSVQRITRKQN